MRKSRTIPTLVASLIFFTPLITAAPTSAVTVIPVDLECGFNGLTVTPSAVTVSAGDIIRVTPAGPVNASVTLSGATGLSPLTLNDGATDYTVQASGGGSITFTNSSACSGQTVVTLSLMSAGGPSGSLASAPQTFELSLAPTHGTNCTNSSESGSAGTWINLPAANDCTPPTTQANANLLGWATTPNFPVDIAKRQVDNGWGAYEIFNEEGQLTAVFIPAGGSTFLSGSGQLYPIWSE